MTDVDDQLLRSVRILRRLDGADETPWPGARAILPNGEACLLVSADEFDDAWPGWSADPDGHVAAAREILRTGDGHSVVLLPLRERLTSTLDRRAAAGAALTDGEAVTIAVSILRACTELPDRVHGEWWLSDDARPVFAVNSRGEDAVSSAAAVLESLAAGAPRLQRTLIAAAVLVGEPDRLARECESVEAELFAATPPEPLVLDVFTPRHSRTLALHADGDQAAALDEPPAGLWGSLVRHVDADWADALSQTTTAIWRRLRAPGEKTSRRGRGGPLIVAGVVVAAVLGGAALLPAAAEPAPSGAQEAAPMTSAATTPPVTTDGNTEAAAEARPDSLAGDAEDDPLEEVLADLLDARTTCAGDEDCLSRAVADPATPLAPGAVDLPSTSRSIVLFDDLGDVAVARVGATDGSARDQIVVIARADGKWLLRDVHDVAEQP